jgi:hypothetical protein
MSGNKEPRTTSFESEHPLHTGNSSNRTGSAQKHGAIAMVDLDLEEVERGHEPKSAAYNRQQSQAGGLDRPSKTWSQSSLSRSMSKSPHTVTSPERRQRLEILQETSFSISDAQYVAPARLSKKPSLDQSNGRRDHMPLVPASWSSNGMR